MNKIIYLNDKKEVTTEEEATAFEGYDYDSFGNVIRRYYGRLPSRRETAKSLFTSK